MADDNAVELIKRGDRRWAARATLDSLRQEIALNFAPHHAVWTADLSLGSDYAAHLVDSAPLIIADDFCGMIGSMLRPSGKQWFWHRAQSTEINDMPEVRAYLDWRSTQMNRIVFDRVTGAEGALDEADEFYGLFGDAVLSVDYASPSRTALRVQHYHSKDAVWTIGKDNKPDTISRKERLACRVLAARFSMPGDTVHAKIKEACERDGDTEFEIRHEVLPAEEYDAYVKKTGSLRRRDGWASVWIDVTNKSILREAPAPTFRYVVPRAGRRYGYAYGLSRATMVALPDARLIQQQAMAILEAAEKSINPPLVATHDAVRGAISLGGGDITWVDKAYDERTGEAVRPLDLGKNFKLGLDVMMRTEAQLARAFKLDRLRYPDTSRTKTREEAAFLIDEFVRAALPMFAPMKVEYSDEFLFECDRLIEMAGGYSAMPMPDELRQHPLVFQWDNPLTDMLERQKAQRAAEVAQIGQTTAALDAAAAQAPSLMQIDTNRMLRDTVTAVGAAAWLRTEDEAAQQQAQGAKAAMIREAVAAGPNIADVVHRGAQAAQIAAEIPNPAEPAFPLLPAPV